MSADTPVIIGAGLAGLATALRLAPQPCVVLTGGALGEGAASEWAQGGIAAAIGPQDSPDHHADDTLAAAAGLGDPDITRAITAAAPDAVTWLHGLGARFDVDERTQSFRLGLEGGHSHHRVVHANGDGSGTEILRAVIAAVRQTPSITVLEHTRATRLVLRGGAVAGVEVAHAGQRRVLNHTAMVLATGGSGGLWQQTTNPPGARGQGLAIAARAGARVRDLEMVQFHPTALDVGADPMPLVSEAVRGAGAILTDSHGTPLVTDPLATRDVVARAIWEHQSRGGSVHLDARTALGAGFARAFPRIHRTCVSAGIDPSVDLVPVAPAAHYQCGGVVVDRQGRTSVPGLWAVGEVASTGLHGGNRLASNSLLEAVVCAGWVAADLSGRPHPNTPDGPTAEPDDNDQPADHPADTRPPGDQSHLPLIRRLMSDSAGLVRDAHRLGHAVETLTRRVHRIGIDQVDDATITALLICVSARRRTESRGGHFRSDLPHQSEVVTHTTLTLDEALGSTGAPSAPDRPTHPTGA